jgi:predicted dehydrogenase
MIDQTTQNSGVLNAAILGCGRVAGSHADPARRDLALCHAAGYRDAPGIQLSACCDADLGALRAFAHRWSVPQTFSDLETMVRRARPDVLSICTPTALHGRHLLAAFDAGVPTVLLEKPVCYNSAEARELLDRARQSCTIVTINYFRRFDPAVARLRTRIQRGEMGAPQRVGVLYNKGLLHNGSHFVDLIRCFFGEFDRVRTLRARDLVDGDMDADLDCEMVSGLPVAFHCLDHQAYNLAEMDILLEGGRVRITNSGRIIEISEPGQDDIFPHLRFLCPSRQVGDNSWCTVYTRIMTYLAETTRGAAAPICTLADGLSALAVYEAACDSLRLGRAVSVDELLHDQGSGPNK